MTNWHFALGSSSTANSVTWPLQDNRNIHTKDSDIWVIFLPRKVSVIPYTKRQVALSVKIPRWNQIFSTRESICQELFNLFVPDGSFASIGAPLLLSGLDSESYQGPLWFNTSYHLKNTFAFNSLSPLLQHQCLQHLQFLAPSLISHHSTTSVDGSFSPPIANTLDITVPKSPN